MGTVTRNAPVRGVTTPSPEGWFVPEPAERLAALARHNGWEVIEQKWWLSRANGLQTFFLAVGRPLLEGEYSKAKGIAWQYHLVWEEVPEEERRKSRMTIRVSRAYTPATGKWGNGPNLKAISDTITRNPLRRNV